jgi:hypothetical protein
LGKSAARKSEQLQNEAANRFSQLATGLSNESAPQRSLLSDYYQGVIKGGPAAYKAISPQVDFAKTQFANARRQINNTAPIGGAVPQARTNLATSEAQTISGMFRDKIQEALQGLQQLSEFGTSGGLQATGGVSNVGSALGQLSAQRLGAWTGALGGIGQALGSYFGGRK